MNFTEITTSSIEVLTQWGLKVLGAIVVLLIGRMIASGLRRTVHKALAAREVDATLVPFLSKLVYYLTLAVVVIAVLSLFGIQTTSLVAMLGAAGLAIGLALQGTLSHLAAGVMLLIFRPFKVGDMVEVGGTTGKVNEIGVFSTTLTTPDNVKITVPNSNVYGATIKNYNGYDTRRVDMVIGIAYGDDIGKAIQVIEGVLGADERILTDPTPQVAVSELADSSVNLVVRPWCKAEDYWGVKFDLTRQIKETLEAAGCSIPFPQHDVTLITQAASGQ
jgi:small conductance mechanosensitive channel